MSDILTNSELGKIFDELLVFDVRDNLKLPTEGQVFNAKRQIQALVDKQVSQALAQQREDIRSKLPNRPKLNPEMPIVGSYSNGVKIGKQMVIDQITKILDDGLTINERMLKLEERILKKYPPPMDEDEIRDMDMLIRGGFNEN